TTKGAVQRQITFSRQSCGIGACTIINCHIMQGIPVCEQPGGCLKCYHCESKDSVNVITRASLDNRDVICEESKSFISSARTKTQRVPRGCLSLAGSDIPITASPLRMNTFKID